MNVFLSTKADRQLKKLPTKMHSVLLTRIKKLAINPVPVNSKKLINRNGWRIRIGDYRILYTFEKKKNELTILSVAHRRDAYK